jgi:hypothetical protein
LNTSSKEIHARIVKFATDLVDDLQDIFIADMIKAVAERSPRVNPHLGKSKPTRAKGAKRSPDELEAITKRLHAYVSKHPGERIEQIAAAMGVPTKELNLPCKKLIAERKLHTKGHKRATTYTAK